MEAKKFTNLSWHKYKFTGLSQEPLNFCLRHKEYAKKYIPFWNFQRMIKNIITKSINVRFFSYLRITTGCTWTINFNSIIFVIVCGLLSGSESVQLFNRLFIHVLLLGIKLSRLQHWDPINRFNTATCFVPVPSQDLDFQHHMSWSFLLSVNSIKMWGIVDIGGIDVNHCLNFFFICLEIS